MKRKDQNGGSSLVSLGHPTRHH